MPALFPQPENRNFLAQFNWKLFIKKCPNVTYFGQGINLPSLVLPAAEQPNPFVVIPQPGDHIRYDDLSCTFVVDENLTNWLEIHDWMTGLGFPENYEQYKKLKESGDGGINPDFSGLFSDALLTVTTNQRNPQIDFEFEGLWPTALSELTFNSTDTDVQYLSATVLFRFILYRHKKP